MNPHAEEALRFGFSPIPLNRKNGKRPLPKAWQEIGQDEVNPMLEDWSGNVGVRTGLVDWGSDREKVVPIFVVDIDVQDEGLEMWQQLLDEHNGGEEIKVPTVVTPSGGLHLYFLYNPQWTKILKSVDHIIERNGKKYGIDIKAHRGQVVYPGSVYKGCVSPDIREKEQREGKEPKKHKCGAETDAECLFAGKKYEWLISPEEISCEDGGWNHPQWLTQFLPFEGNEKKNRKPQVGGKVSRPTSPSGARETIDLEANLPMLKKLLGNLSDSRFHGYNDTLLFIWAMRGAFGDSEQCYNFVQENCARCPDKYDRGWVDSTWNQFDEQRNYPKLGSLIHWLKDDLRSQMDCRSLNPRQIEAMVNEKLASILPKKNWFFRTREEYNLFRDDTGQAEAYYNAFGKEHVVTYNDKGDGYLWDEERLLWIPRQGLFIRNTITNVLEPIIDGYIKRPFNTGDETLSLHKAHLDELRSIRRKILTSRGCKGVFEKLVSHTHDPNVDSKMNKISHLLPCNGGEVVNLKTGETEPRTKSHYFTFECPVELSTMSGVAEKFMSSLCGETDKKDREYTRFLQKICGYCLTGETNEKKFFLLWGLGNNGKSTFINILNQILGEFQCALDKSVLIKGKTRREGPKAELVPLSRVRLGVHPELDEHDVLDAAQVKALTGGDAIYARDLYQRAKGDGETFFRTQAKMVLMTNFPPILKAWDQAAVERICPVPFLQRFDKTKENTEYINSLTEKHLDEIFSWMVEGAVSWYKEGLGKLPQVCDVQFQEYLNDINTVGKFLKDECEEGNFNSKDPENKDSYWTRRQTIQKAYESWCTRTGENKFSMTDVRTVLSRRYGKSVKITLRDKSRVDVYKGIRWLGEDTSEGKDGFTTPLK